MSIFAHDFLATTNSKFRSLSLAIVMVVVPSDALLISSRYGLLKAMTMGVVMHVVNKHVTTRMAKVSSLSTCTTMKFT